MKVIAIAHKKGGVGKTTIAQNLCVFLQKQNKKFISIDLDSQQQLSKFAKNREANRGEKIEVYIPKNESELREQIEAGLSSRAEFAVLDLGGYDSDISRTVLLLADSIVIPLSNTANDFDGFVEFLYALKTILQKNPTAKVLVALNRIHHADKKAKQRLKQDIASVDFLENILLCEAQIPANKSLTNQLEAGKTPLDEKTFFGIGKILEEFCTEIIGQTNKG